MTATDRREEYWYDAAGRLTERLVFGISKGMGTGQEETGNGDAGRTDAERIDAGRADAGIIGLGSIGNEIHSSHTDERRLEDSIEKSLAGRLSHEEIGNTGMLGEVVCPTELALSASYHYSYDRQGNTISDGENQYRYDSKNRLTEIETIDGGIQKNRYDGEGLRAELEENGELTRFLYSGRDIVAEQDGKNNTVRYVRGLELLSSDSECARTYYHYASDELGSITHVTGINGTVLNRYVYDAFGNQREKEDTVRNRFGFTGEICDGLTGQYYLRARFYNPVIGRFLNEDTYYGDGLNLYNYCHNNPVNYVDPSGHWCEGKEGGRASEGGSETIKNVYETGGRKMEGLSVDEILALDDEATDLYNKIRNSTDDIAQIAKQTGIPEWKIERIKNHVFLNEHILRDRVGQFDSDIEIADAWKRLTEGNYTQNDLDLMEHEYYEHRFEEIFKTDYSTAHNRTVETGRVWDPYKEVD